MRTVTDILPDEAKASPEAQSARIASAYAAVFSGRGAREDAELVLIDLAQFTRYYDTASLHQSPARAHAENQRRAVMQRVLDAMTIAGEPADGLLKAVLLSPPIDVIEETD